jgi:hypothetical protein
VGAEHDLDVSVDERSRCVGVACVHSGEEPFDRSV